MENYIVLNGRKAELTDKQIKLLGLKVDPPKVFNDLTMDDVLKIIRDGDGPTKIPVRSILNIAGIEVKVIGHNHDVHEDDVRLMFKHRPTMTVICTHTIGDHRMHPGACEKGWYGSEMRKWLNEDVIKNLPAELRAVIQPACRLIPDSNGHMHTCTDKLFLPTESELFGSAIYSPCMAGNRYDAFETSADRVILDADGDSTELWLASSSGVSYFTYVDKRGRPYSLGSIYANGCAPCFLIS